MPHVRNESFEAFFRAVFPRAVGAAVNVLSSRAAAEDMAAEAMARAYADWPNLEKLPYRDAWVLRVTTNLALDAARRRRVEPETAQGVDVSEIVTSRVALASALRKLPRRQREIVALRHLAGLSEAEVASTLGLAPGTVKSHGHRAMNSLRAWLGEPAEVSAS